jgi:hypothetical protein
MRRRVWHSDPAVTGRGDSSAAAATGLHFERSRSDVIGEGEAFAGLGIVFARARASASLLAIFAQPSSRQCKGWAGTGTR